MDSISVTTWNTQWATPSSERGTWISAILAAAGAYVALVTEGVRELLPAGGSTVDAGDDWGYGPQHSRRKVIVWSRYPLKLNVAGVEGAARGRLTVATAETPAGPVRIVGVCIPWRDAHVSTGRGDAAPWSEHMDYLDRFEGLLAQLDDDMPTVIAGDFNQRILCGRQPIASRTGSTMSSLTGRSTQRDRSRTDRSGPLDRRRRQPRDGADRAHRCRCRGREVRVDTDRLTQESTPNRRPGSHH